VALPSKTRGVEMLSLLSPESAALWSSPKHLMLSAWEQRRKGIRPVTPFVGISPQEYPRYITRKLQADMVYLVHHSPGMIYNGVFGIVKDPKDNSIRDIIDARPFNCARGGVATPVHLPSPADLARLQFAPGERVVVGKMDISNYYHHIRTPRWMHRLCALPPLTPQQLTSMGLDPTGPRVPVCSTLCMGILDAVPIAQEISVRIARAACPSIRFLHELPKDTPVVMSLGPVLAIYLDDFAPIAAEQHSTHAQAVKTALQAGMEAAGFIVHITKDVAISPAPCDVHDWLPHLQLGLGGRCYGPLTISLPAFGGPHYGFPPALNGVEQAAGIPARRMGMVPAGFPSPLQRLFLCLQVRPPGRRFCYPLLDLALGPAGIFHTVGASPPTSRPPEPPVRATRLLHRCIEFRGSGGLAPRLSPTRYGFPSGHVKGVGVPRPYQRA